MAERAARMGKGIAPMKAATAELPPAGDDHWLYEVKWDGYRTIVFVDGGEVRLQSSNMIDVTKRWPELGAIGGAVNAESAIIDGEVVVFDDTGRSDFGRLARGEGTVSFVAFDVLAVNGTDTTALPLEQRRRLLDQLLEPGDRWAVSPLHDDGRALLAATAASGMEGIMAKRRDSTYVPGKRSPSWRKVKHRRRQELVIVGWQEGDRSRETSFGSLILGVVTEDGLAYCGSVGSGFDDRALRTISTLLRTRERRDCPLIALPPKGAVVKPHWVEPGLVAEVAFAEWTIDNVVRQASFLGLRDDKDWHTVVREPMTAT